MDRAQAAVGCRSCAACDAGKYLDAEASAPYCKLCPRGTYSPNDGNSRIDNCTLCIPGKYAESEGNTRELDCQLCPAGKFSVVNGSTSNTTCTDCVVGKFLVEEGGDHPSDCHPCEVPHLWRRDTLTRHARGRRRCRHQHACTLPFLTRHAVTQAGTFSNRSGATTPCVGCSAGFHAPGTGGSTCHICPLGRFSASESASACLSCFNGTFSEVLGATSCLSCPPDSTSVSRYPGIVLARPCLCTRLICPCEPPAHSHDD